jgi:dual specificity tyrosine-phosphorylation-regulated kinase 2/3/4
LYQHLKSRNFQGLAITDIRSITRELLQVLTAIHAQRLIHCDLKPENILFTESRQSVLVIDFECSFRARTPLSACYVQSRYYRAPKVMLRLPITCAIDMWSVGCIVAELVTGIPLFAEGCETDQIAKFMEVVGQPPQALVQRSPRRVALFGKEGRGRSGSAAKLPVRTILQNKLHAASPACIDFIARCFEWDPARRQTAHAGLEHVWIQKALGQPRFFSDKRSWRNIFFTENRSGWNNLVKVEYLN